MSLTSFQLVGAEEYTVSDQNSCEDLGGIWDVNACDLFSFTVKKSDTLQIIVNTVRIHETLDNFGKIVVDGGTFINSGGNITNHYGGFITIKSGGGIFNNIGIISNEGTIINEGGETRTTIFNNDQSIFYNKATGIIFNGNQANFFNLGVLYNNNIIYNDKSGFSNSGETQAEEIRKIVPDVIGINFTNIRPIIFNDSGGIIFNKLGSFIFNDRQANFTNGDEGIIFNEASSTIFNRGIFTNTNKIFSDCGGIILDYYIIVEPIIEIPCNLK